MYRTEVDSAVDPFKRTRVSESHPDPFVGRTFGGYRVEGVIGRGGGDLPVEVGSHDVHVTAPARGVSAEYGEYISVQCKMCHGENLAGSSDPGAGPNITPGGDPGNWTEADFINTIRTGTTPEGDELNPEMMPWELISLLTDDELRAVWLYLQSVPAVQTPLPSATP